MEAVIEGFEALRGVAQVAAVTIVAELGEISRFSRARQLMGYGRTVASEYSSAADRVALAQPHHPLHRGFRGKRESVNARADSLE